MANTVIIVSALNLWSMEIGKGAPSFYNTVKGYVDRGWDTYLINPDSDEAIALNHLEGLHHIAIPPYGKKKPANKARMWFYNNAFQAYCNKKFSEALDSVISRIDARHCILYAYEIAAVPAVKKYSEKCGVKMVSRFQGTILGNKRINLINKIAYRQHFSALSTPADLIIMTNDGTKGESVLKQLKNPSPVCFWKNGINPIQFSPDNGHDRLPHSLITVSRLAKWKRVDRAISALPKVRKQYPDCKLHIVGEGEEKANLIALAESLHVSENTCFLGNIPQKEVYSYMMKSEIFLSLYDLSNVGNPLFEAMMCGKAILTLNNGDTGTIITDGTNGVLFDEYDADRCADKIIELFDHPEMIERLGNAAREYADTHLWSWEERISKEVSVVKKLLPQ